MQVPMPKHDRIVEITLSHTYAEDPEFETIECPGSGQPVDVNPVASIFDIECPDCGRTIEDLADMGDIL